MKNIGNIIVSLYARSMKTGTVAFLVAHVIDIAVVLHALIRTNSVTICAGTTITEA